MPSANLLFGDNPVAMELSVGASPSYAPYTPSAGGGIALHVGGIVAIAMIILAGIHLAGFRSTITMGA